MTPTVRAATLAAIEQLERACINLRAALLADDRPADDVRVSAEEYATITSAISRGGKVDVYWVRGERRLAVRSVPSKRRRRLPESSILIGRYCYPTERLRERIQSDLRALLDGRA